MATIVVHSQGTRIEARSRHLRFRQPGRDIPPRDLPLIAVERLLLFGRIELSNRCIHLLAQENCDVTWFSRFGRYRARLEGTTAHNVAFRRQQFRCADRPAWCLAMARRLIATKIANQRAVLHRAGRSDPSERDDLLARLATASAACAHSPDQNALRGQEGSAARQYFQAWAACCGAGMPWNGRNRRPPQDPLNAALSLGYTLLLAEVDAHCRAIGADAWLGFFHTDHAGAPALALDLMETLRPLIVDRLILDLCRHKRLKPEHFHSDGQGVRFTDDAFRRFLTAFEARMRHGDDDNGGRGRDLLQEQVASYRQACETADPETFHAPLLRT